MEQGSEEWFAARLGKVTASRVSDVTAATKSGPAAARKNYAAQLVAERLSGETGPTFSNAAMQWGTDTEPQARAAYSLEKGLPVSQIGFVDHPNIEMAGASPDGLVGQDGLVEIKCPNTATHIETILRGTADAKYVKQMQFQMACTQRQWCDFVSFDPRLPPEMSLFVQRVAVDAEAIEEIESKVREFLSEVSTTVSYLERLYRSEAA